MNRTRKHVLQINLIPIILLLTILGTSHTLYRIKTTVDEQIYGSPRGRIQQKTPADVGLPYRDIQLETESKVLLEGWYIQNENSDKGIILSPGRGTNRWTLLQAAPFLYEEGYNVLLFDPRTTGLSEGREYGFGYYQSKDIAQIANHLKKVEGVERIGVLGISAGASAGLLATLNTDIIGAVVADSPFANLKMVASSYEEFKNDWALQFLFPVYMEAANLTLGVDISVETDLLKQIPELDTPVFFIHSQDDQMIAAENSQLLYEKAPGPKESWFPSGAAHGRVSEEYPDEYRARVVEFFDNHLGENARQTAQ
ncbi:MAG: alpha/beta hydrolase [Candidatus Acetothermia bacterium]